jgi:AcrR family transcriptional regulator
VSKAGRGQRERLLGAMIEVAARHGYGGATVARVIKRAGVSRATFYEQFGDRHECFLAAVRVSAARVAGGLHRGQFEKAPPRQLIASALAAVDRDPAAARVVLIESLAGPAPARAEHERLLGAAQGVIEVRLQRGLGPLRLEVSPRALLGGMVGVLATRLQRGETGRMIDLLNDFEAWTRSYATTAPRGRGAVDWKALGVSVEPPIPPQADPLDARLPRGRSAMPPAMVAAEHRQRIFAALARLARERGYAAVTVADIVATAGIGRDTFYELFRGKQEAFLAAQSFALENSLALAASRYFGDKAWPERVWDAALALLGYVASVPDLAVLDFVESYAVGPPAIRRSFEGRMAYTLFLEEGFRQRPEARALPRLCSEGIAGAILELMRVQAVEGRAERMQELVPQAVYLAIAPFIGPATALQLISAKAGRPIPRLVAAEG